MKYYLTLFLLMLVGACTKEKNQIANQLFPDAVGNQWIYKYDDRYTNSDQYIYVDIVGTGILPDGQTATIWTTTLQDASNNKYLIDSSFVVVDDQKVVFYAAPCRSCEPPSFDEKRRYMFPLQVGKIWFSDKFYGDTTRVLSENTVTVPAGTFGNTFKLSKTAGGSNSYTDDTIWLAPKIGMTQYYQHEHTLGPIPGNGIWKLASYKLK